MADAEQLARIRRSVEEWNSWREENHSVQVDLSDANLRQAKLFEAKLFHASLLRADLSGADLSRANLGAAVLFRANLRQARLSEASLSLADLREAYLSQADLGGAHFGEANLADADLSRANFREATFWKTIFGDTNLKHAVGLDACHHSGPSTIDHRTLAKSWPLPEVFLRGCGLPDALITYLPSLVSAGAIQLYSCFISYSTQDEEFANRLYADLQNNGVRCWFAPHDVQGGKKLHEQIDEAIRRYERLLLILSPHSMSSKWVKTEIRTARRRELAEKKRVLFPVRLASYDALRDWKLFDADEGEDLAAEIREYYIPDFTEWKSHDFYQEEFEKLLRDLRMDGAK
jgi:uncharacterized protein YjbI with pentapeptide repeats